MKKLIALLRITALISFIFFLLVFGIAGRNTYLAQMLACISILSFLIIVIVQLYRFYIRNYFQNEDA